MTSFLHRLVGLVGGMSLAVILVAAPAAVHAQAKPAGAPGFGQVLQNGLNQAAPIELQGGNQAPSQIVGNILRAVLELLGVVLFAYMLYGGYLWMTAGGEAGQVKTAMAVIKNAIIGLVIMALAYSIATFVIGSLGNTLSPTQGAQGSNST